MLTIQNKHTLKFIEWIAQDYLSVDEVENLISRLETIAEGKSDRAIEELIANEI